VPRGLKITAGVVVGGIALWAAGSAIIPNLTDPEQNLARVARRVAAGPKNSEDSKHLSEEFDRALRGYLCKLGNKPNPEILKDLQKVLPASAFEVHVIDLPRGLKIVEVDTVLQAADYLVMKGSSGNHAFPLTGIEVFDDARLINESAGPMLVAIGHSAGDPPHRPQVRVFALLPDSLSDETDKLLPPIRGEGTAKFARNGRDIVLNVSLLSLGQLEQLFAPGAQAEDGVARQYLEWKDAHYSSRYEYAQSPFTALYAVARCMRYPDLTTTHRQFLGPRGEQLVRENKSPDAGNFKVRRMIASGDRASYLMSGSVGAFLVEVGRSGGVWQITSFKNAPGQTGSHPAAAQQSVTAAAPPETARAAPQTRVAQAAPIVVHQAPAAPTMSTGTQPAPATKAEGERQAKESVRQAQEKRKEQERLARERKEQERLAKLEKERQAKAEKERLAREQQEKERLARESQKKQEAATRPQPATHGAGEQATISARLTAGAVNLRSAPSTSAKPVTSIGKGAAVEIVGKQSGWYKVRYQGAEGYVYAGLVDYKKPDAYTTATLTRTEPVTDAHKKPLGKPAVGDRLVILGGLENNKYKVQLANGKTGYVDKDALDVTIEEPQLVP